MTGREPVCAAGPAETPRKILVVEDEVLIRLSVAAFLREHGRTVVEAMDASEAMRMIMADPAIALVFTDITMPGEADGRDLVHWLDGHRPAVKVIVASGVRLDGNGSHPFLVKPYDYEALKALIARLMGD